MKTKKEYFCNFLGYECVLVFEKYIHDNRIAIELVIKETGEPMAYATTNILGVQLAKDEVIIKNYSENEGMVECLQMAGIIGQPLYYVETGFVKVPVCKLLITP